MSPLLVSCLGGCGKKVSELVSQQKCIPCKTRPCIICGVPSVKNMKFNSVCSYCKDYDKRKGNRKPKSKKFYPELVANPINNRSE